MNVQMKVYIYSEHSLLICSFACIGGGGSRLESQRSRGVQIVYSRVYSRGVQIRSETGSNPIRSDLFGFRNQNIHFGSD
jgi:hypothetical protein